MITIMFIPATLWQYGGPYDEEPPMVRALALIVCMIPAVAAAQSAQQHQMNGGVMPPMNHQQMMREHMGTASTPTQAGQSAFAAIQEIVAILEADPKTDWSKVNIEALRQHLIDMNNVTLSAEVKSDPVEGGIRFAITGAGAVRDSIRRMVTAHAATMNGVAGWNFIAAEVESGATLVVQVPAKDIDKLKALGFVGIMTRGMHHQEHHLMLARGENPDH